MYIICIYIYTYIYVYTVYINIAQKRNVFGTPHFSMDISSSYRPYMFFGVYLYTKKNKRHKNKVTQKPINI